MGCIIFIHEKVKEEVDLIPHDIPELKSIVSNKFDEDLSIPSLSKTFSAIKAESSIELSTIFINFILKYRSLIYDAVLPKNPDDEDYDDETSKVIPDYSEVLILAERLPWVFSSQAKHEILM